MWKINHFQTLFFSVSGLWWLFPISYIESSSKWISPEILESSVFIPFLYYFYFNSSSARTIFIRLKFIWTCLWHAWTGDIPNREFEPSIRTPFEKIIHFNCPLEQCNNFISFREAIYFLKHKMFFIEIFEITEI